jgi:L-2-hydroxyglutarate oxidase
VRVAVLEKEAGVARHQTGHNSGVIHSGLYYRRGSLKAQNCVAGREALYRFCAEHGIAHERCGKVVVATTEEELPALAELERRGKANGLAGLRRLDAAELRELEPSATGVAALHVPETGIVDYVRVAEVFADRIRDRGGEVRTRHRLQRVHRRPDGFELQTTAGSVRCRFLINCAGLQADRVARICGVKPGVQIIPFRGEYYQLTAARRSLVRNLIYPVPDPAFPFLGVHFTRRIDGEVEAGPNAVLALKREGYRRLSFSLADTLETVGYEGFRKLARRYWRMGLAEMRRSFSRRLFLLDLQRLLPALTAPDIRRGGAGVRAQAVAPDGALLDDFHIVTAPGMVHVLNAPSPAATASLSIGETVAADAHRHFELS